MRVEQLFEGLSPILFHAVSSKKFIVMSNKNIFLTSSTGQRDVRAVSFSRNRSNRFLYTDHVGESGIDLNRDLTVVWEFDGRHLARRYKGKPVDSYTVGKDDPTYDPDIDDVYTKNPAWDLMEDRILAGSRKELPFNASDVRALHFILPTSERAKKVWLQHVLERLPRIESKYGTVKIYDSVGGFAIGRESE